MHTKCQSGGGNEAKEPLAAVQGRAQTQPAQGVSACPSSFLGDQKKPSCNNKKVNNITFMLPASLGPQKKKKGLISLNRHYSIPKIHLPPDSLHRRWANLGVKLHAVIPGTQVSLQAHCHSLLSWQYTSLQQSYSLRGWKEGDTKGQQGDGYFSRIHGLSSLPVLSKAPGTGPRLQRAGPILHTGIATLVLSRISWRKTTRINSLSTLHSQLGSVPLD